MTSPKNNTGLRPRFSRRSLSAACLCLTLLFCAQAGFGQGTTPQRGFQPAGSYALGDFEVINTKNGNLMLNFPLGKLPAGRAGLSGGISLNYNSKIYDSYVQYEEYCGSYPCELVQKEVVRPSTEGGWQYNMGFEVQVIDRMDQYLSYTGRPECPDDAITYVYKVRLKFPDGSVHDLKDGGLVPYAVSGDGYSDVRIDGFQKYCRVFSTYPTYQYVEDYRLPQPGQSRAFYTTDGTYVRLEITYDGDNDWHNNTWALHFPDGTRVVEGGGVQRIFDRNNNYVELRRLSNYNGTGHPAKQIIDQLGRSVTLEYGTGTHEDSVHAQGFGQTLTWKVRWKGILLNKTYVAGESMHGGLTDFIHELYVVDKITLPSQSGGLEYKIGYNAPDSPGGWSTTPVAPGWGEVSSVTLPSGGKASYQYEYDGRNGDLVTAEVLGNRPTRKDVVYRPEYDLTTAVSNTPCNPAAETCVTETWLYVLSDSGGGGWITGPDGGVTYDSEGSYSNQRDLLVRPDGTKVERVRAYNPPPGTFQPQYAEMNSYVKQEFTSIKDAAGNYVKTGIKEYDRDKNGNVTRIKEYDWVAYGGVARNVYDQPTGALPAGAVLKRVIVNEYWLPTPDASDNTSQWGYTYNQYGNGTPTLLNALKSTEVRTGLGDTSAVTRTEFYYDDPESKGNVTLSKSWDSAKGPLTRPLETSRTVYTSQAYDPYGNPTLSTDARGHQTLLVYGVIGGYSGLYPTETRAAYNTPAQLVTTQQYDFGTGLVTQTTDPNGVAAATTYDVFGRSTLACAADNVPAAKTCTATEYSDSARRAVARKDLSAALDGKLVSVEHYDQLGRVRLSRRLEDAAAHSPYDETHGVKVQTRYRVTNPCHPDNTPSCVAANGQSMASYQLVSNPYRAAYSYQAAGEPSMGWSRAKSDSGGRVVEAQSFNGSSLPAPWGANASSSGAMTSSYDAEFTTVTDQQGKARRNMVNSLGQLTRVDEPTASGLGAPGAPNQPTSYTYDALSNLVQVQQGGQTRTFSYSSLSSLLSATLPESGTTSYTYDANGNFKTKTDARGITISYEYDELNRGTTVDYSNTAASPDIKRYYDNATAGAYGKGRFYYDCKGGDCGATTDLDHRAVDSYDALGRPLVVRQHFKPGGVWSPAYQTSRQYDRAGGVTSQTYPSGRAVSYSYDAAGRLSGFTGNLGDGVLRSYSTAPMYDPAGRRQQERYGTQVPLYHKRHYNARGQLYDVRLSTVPWATNDWDWNRGVLAFYYGAPHGQTDANNNGNVTRTEHWVPTDPNSPYGTGGQGPWAIYATDYAYDALNRLDTATETALASGAAAATNYVHAYKYDRYGNREIDLSRTWINTARVPAGAINATQFSVNTSNNRLGVPAGQGGVMTYDNAGNLTADTYSAFAAQRSYDAENRMTLEQNSQSSVFHRYGYDADGRRTRRDVGGQVTHQIYGLDGELVAEYPAGGAPASPRKEYGYRGGELLITAEADHAWVDDSLPAGAWHCVCGVNEAWNWVGGSPAPVSGSVSARMLATAGLHQQFFEGATQTMSVGAGETLVAYVYLDPANPPSEIMLQWSDYSSGWEHRAYWGANNIAWGVDGTNSRRYMGALPAAGQWVRLEVPAAAVGLEGQTVHGLAVTLYGGRATWDKIGKGSVRWLVSDHLGTPRMTVDATGGLLGVARHDYLPFGEELLAGVGGRTAAQGYNANDNVRQKVTGKERDNETGLDYFLSRYYSSTQGRFTSSDEPLAGASLGDPQTWNAYAYTSNNPLNRVDPDGQRWAKKKVGREIEYAWFDDKEDENGDSEYKYALENGWSQVDFDESKTAVVTGQEYDQAGNTVFVTITLNPNGTASQKFLTATPVTGFLGVAGLALGLDYFGYAQNMETAARDAYSGAERTIIDFGETTFDFARAVAGGNVFRRPKPHLSGKEGAKNIPSWAKGERPLKGENGDGFARRLLDRQYGKGNYPTKSQTEYSQLKKYADRSFEP